MLDFDRYKGLSKKKNLKGSEALKAVKYSGYDLKYVINQTEEICLEAVRQNGFALKYVNNQTEEICLAAVKENGFALKYIDIRKLNTEPKKLKLRSRKMKLLLLMLGFILIVSLIGMGNTKNTKDLEVFKKNTNTNIR